MGHKSIYTNPKYEVGKEGKRRRRKRGRETGRGRRETENSLVGGTQVAFRYGHCYPQIKNTNTIKDGVQALRTKDKLSGMILETLRKGLAKESCGGIP